MILFQSFRVYQAEAVNWMLRKEEEDNEVKGGILADEMGLGKTVEVLALILNRPRSVKLVAIPEPIDETANESSSNKKIKLEDETQEDVSNEVSVVNVLKNIDNITNQVVEPQATEPAKEKKRKRTAKVLLTNHYNTTLAQYSGLNSLKARQSGNQGPTFLCVCGKKEETDSSPPIECTVCHKKQHSSCVHYDLEDPLRGPYRCPRCWIDIEPLKSGATLIITPPSISNQWVEEIRRHVKADHLKVLLYKVHNLLLYV